MRLESHDATCRALHLVDPMDVNLKRNCARLMMRAASGPALLWSGVGAASAQEDVFPAEEARLADERGLVISRPGNEMFAGQSWLHLR
jgi:hypothetical protein